MYMSQVRSHLFTIVAILALMTVDAAASEASFLPKKSNYNRNNIRSSRTGSISETISRVQSENSKVDRSSIYLYSSSKSVETAIVAVGGGGKTHTTISTSQQLFLIPLLILVASPYIAPLSDQALRSSFTLTKSFASILCQFIAQIGIVYQNVSQKLSKILRHSFTVVQNSVSYASAIAILAITILLAELKVIAKEIWSQMGTLCQNVSSLSISTGANTSQFAQSSFSSLYATISTTARGVVSFISEASFAAGRFIKTQSKFFANEFVNAVEITLRGMVAVPKGIFRGMVWFKNRVPVWWNNVVDSMPSVEKVEEEEEVVLSTPSTQAFLYVTSAYSAIHPYFRRAPPPPPPTASERVRNAVSNAVESVKYKWCPPRALFLTGSLARGIQMSTSLVYIFQPSLGVGALANAGAIVSNERWIACILAGWFSSPRVWRFVGARPPFVKEYYSTKSGGDEGEEGASKKKSWLYSRG